MDRQTTPPLIKITQFDQDLQARIRETQMTSLEAFRRVRQELQQIQERRWAREYHV